MEKNVIQLENLTKTYFMGDTQVKALRGVTYTIKEGDFVAIMGPSGSGKSTLMNIIGCLDKPTTGRYLLDGEDVSKYDKNRLAVTRNKKLGFIFQTFNLLSRTTALENTELPLLYSNIHGKERVKRAMASLESVGLKGREFHKTNQLSGGEQQRVAIARALLNNPALILADEPTGNLDSKTGDEILNIFRRLNIEQKKTLVIITHDPDVGAQARRRIFIRDGLIVREENS